MNDETTTLVCLFHHAAQAEGALADIERGGIADTAVTVLRYPGSDFGPSREALQQLGVPTHDLPHLLDGLRSRGVIIGVVAAEKQVDLIDNIFQRHSAREIDEAIIPEGEPYLAPVDATGPLAGVPVVDQAIEPEGLTATEGNEELPAAEDVPDAEVLGSAAAAFVTSDPAGLAAVSDPGEFGTDDPVVIVVDDTDTGLRQPWQAETEVAPMMSDPAAAEDGDDLLEGDVLVVDSSLDALADDSLDGPTVVSLGSGEVEEPILLEVVPKPDGFLLVELPEGAEAAPEPVIHERSPISPMEPSYGQTH